MPTTSRTLTATSPTIPQLHGSAALIPVKLTGSEGINSLFTYQLVLKTPDALNIVRSQASDFNRDDFLGQELTVTIELDGNGTFIPGGVGNAVNVGAGKREITGLITEARFLREQGRHVYYELTLRPWAELMQLRTNTRVYQDMTPVEVLDALLSEYNFPAQKYLIDDYPKRDYCCQFNETDFAFLCRLCEEYGISYYFEHSDGKHRLTLCDNIGGYQHTSSSAYHQLNFYTPGYVIDEEFVHAFTLGNKLTSGKYSTRDYDYSRSAINLEASSSSPRPTQQNQHEVYEWHQGAHFAQPEAGKSPANVPEAEGEFLARRRMQELRSPAQRAVGAGHLRGIVPGCVFTLNKHPSTSANTTWLILNTTFSIEEIAQESQAASPLMQEFSFHVEFEGHPTTEELRPQRRIPKPYSHGPQIARVVGPNNQNIWTDSYGRIKVQFPWDRLGTNDENSSCWVRVSSTMAGGQLGSMHVPRIGEEVIVSFLGGDPDLPICTGRVYNQMNMPPWSLPDQSALSGFRSRELIPGGGNAAAGRSNHLILDDSDGKIQAQLKSDHQHSQLSLGHITRIEDKAGRKDYRGDGFELRSDGTGVLRAKNGMLITTEGRSNAQSHMKDMGETVQRLTQAREQHESLADLAQQNKAQETNADQSDVAKVIKAQNDAIKGGTSKEGAFPELAEPHLVLASPAGIETTTPQSTHIASGEHIALTSGGHTSLSVGGRLLASVKDGIRLFTYNMGMKLISASGDIDIQALSNSVTILAKLDITHTADKITLSAKQTIVINGGGSYTEWNAGGITSGTAGKHVSHAAKHDHVTPANLGISTLPVPVLGKEQMSFQLHTLVGKTSIAPEPYTLYRDGAVVDKGVTDEWGRVMVKEHLPTGKYVVKLTNGDQFAFPVGKKLAEDTHHIANQGHRPVKDDDAKKSS